MSDNLPEETKKVAARPITPQEARIKNAGVTPPVVFEVFNSFLIARAAQSHITISRDEVVQAIREALGVDTANIYDNRWLDIEDAYVQAGWEVSYSRQSNLGIHKNELGGSWPHWTFVQPAQVEKKLDTWGLKPI